MKKLNLVKEAKKGWPEAESMVNYMLLAINKALVSRETVTIYNFGKFEVVESKVRAGYDFKAQKRIKLPKKLKVKFTPSPSIIKMLNERNLVDESSPSRIT